MMPLARAMTIFAERRFVEALKMRIGTGGFYLASPLR